MAALQKPWILLGALVAASTCVQAVHPLIPVSVNRRDDSPFNINTGGDKDMEAWLGALERAPADTVCPVSCRELADSGDGWAMYQDQASLAACNQTMLVDVVYQTAVSNTQNTDLALRACVADYSSADVSFQPKADVAALCPTPNHAMVDRTVGIVSSVPGAKAQDTFSTDHLLEAGRQVLHQLRSEKPSCTRNARSMGYFQSSLVGVYGGLEVHQHGLLVDILDKFLDHAKETSLSKTTLVQMCEGDGVGADYGVGIIASSTRNFAVIQKTMKSWAEGHCVGNSTGEDWTTVTIRVPKTQPKANSTAIVTRDELSSPANPFSRIAQLNRRADCRTTKVEPGDGCWAVADRCKISQSDLQKYNPRNNFCNTLAVGEIVCCGSGTLPSTIPPGNSDGTCKIRRAIFGDDCTSLAQKCGISGNDFMKINTKTNLCSTLIVGQPVCCSQGKLPYNPPKEKADGYCYDYEVKKGDECASIAVMNDITMTELMSFNKKTWGWIGCDPLYTGKICLSTGSPPMPLAVANTVCGPTVSNLLILQSGLSIFFQCMGLISSTGSQHTATGRWQEHL